MNEIDFVILWVDGNDPAWREEFVRTRQAENDDASEIRYRDWRNLHYWFRSAERFAPWVRKVHFITWGHLPAWLRRDHPKLHIVNHRDFIPAEYLPTFNSNTIELNIHRIEGLADRFVLFNDDTFLTRGCRPEDFAAGGVRIVDACAHPQARRYLKLPFLCDFTSYGSGVVASVSPPYRALAEEYLARFDAVHCFETPNLHWLMQRLAPLGANVCFMA